MSDIDTSAQFCHPDVTLSHAMHAYIYYVLYPFRIRLAIGLIQEAAAAITGLVILPFFCLVQVRV